LSNRKSENRIRIFSIVGKKKEEKGKRKKGIGERRERKVNGKSRNLVESKLYLKRTICCDPKANIWDKGVRVIGKGRGWSTGSLGCCKQESVALCGWGVFWKESLEQVRTHLWTSIVWGTRWKMGKKKNLTDS